MKTGLDLASTVAGVRRGASASATARRGERRAWLILSTAFLTWCLLAAIAVGGLINYRATAVELQWATVSVSRGLASYQPGDGAEPRLITRERVQVLEGTMVRTGPNSQAALTLFDGSEIRLLADSRLGLEAMRRGMFDPSGAHLGVRLEEGPAWFRVTGALPSGELVARVGNLRAQLRGGEFLLWADQAGPRLSVYQGGALVTQGDRLLSLVSGQRVVARGQDGLSEVLPLNEDLLVNGDFSQGTQGWKPLDDLEVKSDSPGQRRLPPVEIGGRPAVAVQFARETSMDRHNKTGLIQEVNRDVRGFRSLKLRAAVQVRAAKLHGGGYAGTEYPMTFVVYYVDDKGGEPNWINGFYYRNDENRPTQFGQPVKQGQWEQYEVELMNQPDRPAFIKSLWVFGAGHDFDALVANLQLLAR